MTFDIYSAMYHLLTIVLEEAESELDALSSNINSIVRGVLSSYVLSPDECIKVHKRVQKAAASMGLQSVITNPLQLLTAEASTFASNTSFIVVLHIHLVDPNLKFDAYNFPHK